MSSHNAASLAADLRQSIGLDKPKSVPKELGVKRKKFDEDCVRKCQEVIGSWSNPFMTSTNIIALSSGITANEDIQNDLLKAKEVGQSRLEIFIKDRIETGTVDFYAPIKKNNLKTFDVKKKTLTMKVKDQKVAIRADRETFARLVVFFI